MSAVEQAAMRWIEARIERDRLEKERDGILCAHEKIVEHSETGLFGLPPYTWEAREGTACWKGHYADEDRHGVDRGWVTHREPEEWCEPCKARQALHERYRKARYLTTGRLGALNRVCRTAYKAPPAKGDGAK